MCGRLFTFSVFFQLVLPYQHKMCSLEKNGMCILKIFSLIKACDGSCCYQKQRFRLRLLPQYFLRRMSMRLLMYSSVYPRSPTDSYKHTDTHRSSSCKDSHRKRSAWSCCLSHSLSLSHKHIWHTRQNSPKRTPCFESKDMDCLGTEEDWER